MCFSLFSLSVPFLFFPQFLCFLSVSLSCLILDTFQVINYESAGSVTVSVSQEGTQRTVSTLLVQRASLSHSGLYECAPSNTNRAAITVHVFKGEYRCVGAGVGTGRKGTAIEGRQKREVEAER